MSTHSDTGDPARETTAMSMRLRHAVALLGVALALGLVTGLTEALILWTKQSVFGQVVFVSRHVLWMAPLLYALIMGAVGVVLAGGGFIWPRVISMPVANFVLVSFGFGCLLLPVGQIHRIAAAILAAGVGIQAARFARRRPIRARRALAGVVLGLGVMAGLAGIVGEIRFRNDSSGFAGPVQTAGTSVPNVLIIIWDTVRAASLSLYGHTSPTTPRLERLALESVVFDQAFSTSPWTLPGHSTLFTGRFPHEVSASWYARLDDAEPTLAEVFSAVGHASGGFVANHHYTSYDSGLARGFETYLDYRLSWDQFLRSSAFTQTGSGERMVRARSLGELWAGLRAFDWWVGVKRNSDEKHSDELNQQFLDWLDGLDGERFFGFVNYFDAHAAYWSPPEFRKRFGSGSEEAYEAAIAYQDDRLGILLDELAERGILDNTIVVVTSDHGELFGEHGLFGHASNLYLPVLHVPLLIRFPDGVHAGKRVGTEVSLRDVAATVLDLAGLQPSPAFPGVSLTRYLTGDSAQAGSPLLAEVEEGRNNAPEDPISRGPVRSVLHEGWQYILNGDGVEELYHIGGSDSDGADLVDRPDSRARLDALRTHLQRLMQNSASH